MNLRVAHDFKYRIERSNWPAMMKKLIIAAANILIFYVQAHEIQNVVHLMLENRGFDTVFGYLDHNKDIDNLVGKEPFCNNLEPNNSNSLKVCTSNTQRLYTDNEPHHMYPDVKKQLFGKDLPSNTLADIKPDMSGFINQIPIHGWMKKKGFS